MASIPPLTADSAPESGPESTERTDRREEPRPYRVSNDRAAQRLRSRARELGPGLITGASDDDPSGIATYSQADAAFGYGTLWTALVTLPLIAAVQLMCARDVNVARARLTS